ncbi:MAG: phosphatidylglycerol lysyltransferase domain-containing protein [Lachnospiraceae bacterium]|nr:phosphatidylglycerol lysyltransferase domain-containing protein [Lachnospiraceae bacterium]
MWNQDDALEFSVMEDMLVFRSLDEDKEGNVSAVYSVPNVNGHYKNLIQNLIDETKELKQQFVLTYLNEERKQMLEELFPGKFQFEEHRSRAEYIYDVEALARLSGRKYHKKKNHVNKFYKTYDFVYENLDATNIEECRAMSDLWEEQRVERFELTEEEKKLGKKDRAVRRILREEKSFQKELRAVEIGLDHFEELGLSGGLIRVNGEVKAFTYGEPITKDTFGTHVEKASNEIPELYAVMNHQFALNHLGDYKYVNREEDLGFEGLRKAKLSYHPAILLDCYTATLCE